MFSIVTPKHHYTAPSVPSTRSQGTLEGHSEETTVFQKISCTTVLNKLNWQTMGLGQTHQKWTAPEKLTPFTFSVWHIKHAWPQKVKSLSKNLLSKNPTRKEKPTTTKKRPRKSTKSSAHAPQSTSASVQPERRQVKQKKTDGFWGLILFPSNFQTPLLDKEAGNRALLQTKPWEFLLVQFAMYGVTSRYQKSGATERLPRLYKTYEIHPDLFVSKHFLFLTLFSSLKHFRKWQDATNNLFPVLESSCPAANYK